MSKVNCKDCQYYNNGRCETLGEYVTPSEGECSWFVQKSIKKVVIHNNCWTIVNEHKPTVFDKITESVETLAEKLVYRDMLLDAWVSTLLTVHFKTEAEAIAATVEDLKKEYKENE
jgi:hypothetical protein